MHSDDSFRRGPIVVALVLSIVLVVGVLVGAKLVYDKAAHQPVAMSDVGSPLGDSAQCHDFLEALPEHVLGHKRAQIADPAPAGAAAWQSDSTRRVTIRCGVDAPLQFTALSERIDAANAEWMEVGDATPGSTLRTWYSVDRFPIVAVTADAEALGDHANPLEELGGAVSTLESKETKPHPIPLTDLQVHAGEDHSATCRALLKSVPDSFGKDITYRKNTTVSLPDGSAVWTAAGFEPVVLRCGVEFPKSYKAGERLNQINSVPWFEDTTLRNGTTASTHYALDQKATVAVNLPHEAGNAALVAITEALESIR
ncbi:hypothetical protein FRC0485_01053 [Corynebacterium diphtheriae]|uniref:DUF3515 domain-containing protein n=1 Tax=Corynebacterium diphtheriae TaxID=1717 RepID=UPI0013CC921B|nr:DUF3515 domain-containing protein [Corynebacterium diphtheriae]MBG9294631.1 DUF3515 domain-containing protein [Corynebacterium diphtheriae bv. mitis]MBG9317147.1 DUF3515 domain-containing protein [Corynebacterium diphtheriae bv. mitis]MBG9371347.1 DUF3515 domain-containing protein [Corynebacterium diphtheriae bv. mitis]CAB0549746.1 hypothetical protein CIP107523_01044 [Corynebacterium diphtheriae]CAB0552082.1 hypothetical protein CIP107529_01167 [Corynebacterium diphtheriae]